jgi:HAD superfamily hydrolase (TIGR01509 family)
MIRAVIFDYGKVLRRGIFLQPKMMELAKQLRDEGYETAVLSNMYAPITWVVKRLGDVKDFKPAVFSSDIGIRKPKPEAYKAVLDQLGFLADECLFVDNRQDNLDGAQKIGMKVVLVKSTDQAIADIRKMLDPPKK